MATRGIPQSIDASHASADEDDAELEFRAEKWVGISGEVCTSGLWAFGDETAYPDILPVSPVLQARMKVWCEANVWPFHPEQFRHIDFETWFETEALAIARMIKESLPDWIVRFWSDFNLNATPSGKRFGIIDHMGNFVDPDDATLERERALEEAFLKSLRREK